jgi:hypothetical protein
LLVLAAERLLPPVGSLQQARRPIRLACCQLPEGLPRLRFVPASIIRMFAQWLALRANPAYIKAGYTSPRIWTIYAQALTLAKSHEGVCTENSNSDVMMMKSAEHWARVDCSR